MELLIILSLIGYVVAFAIGRGTSHKFKEWFGD